MTTIAVCACAMSRNVVAPMSPVIGALFIAGICTPWAEDAGVRLNRDAMTMPMAIDATTIKTPENRVVLCVDITSSKWIPAE